MQQDKSRRIGGLVGPALVAITLSESPVVQPHLYDAQTPPVVYLSGVLIFVAGLAIVRAHNRWASDWTLLVTLSGWLGIGLGLFRMFAAERYQRAAASAPAGLLMVIEGILLLCGLVMTLKAYSRDAPRAV